MTYFIRNERRKKGRIEFSKFEKKIGKINRFHFQKLSKWKIFENRNKR